MPPLAPSPFPESQFTALWNVVVERLSRSRWLGNVKAAEAWLGGADSVSPFALAELPAIRVTPAAGEFRWADECRFDGPFRLEIRYAVKGTQVTHLMDFWQAIATALSPGNAFMDVLYPKGCYNATMSSPGIRPNLICDGQAIEAVGVVTFLTNVRI